METVCFAPLVHSAALLHLSTETIKAQDATYPHALSQVYALMSALVKICPSVAPRLIFYDSSLQNPFLFVMIYIKAGLKSAARSF